ncbi:MAG: hypothetical protein IAE80_22705 [Anaerolinea sp.]|nr:hypothetical protein [Anaerolinea sp.]
MFLALFAALVCVLLLLNFTAPNPTGRRYSSQPPLTTGQGSGQQIGDDAERILAADLHLPNNNAPDQRICFCSSTRGTPPTSECNSCMVTLRLEGNFRRPDFIGQGYIAESKNAQNLLFTQADRVEQIADYVLAARELHQPLWVYVRVNTGLDPAFAQLVETTGGGIVAYFTVPGYVDPVDRAAQLGLIGASGAFGLMLLWEALALRNGVKAPKPRDPLQTSESKVRNTEDFAKSAKERLQSKIDVEDSRPHD